MLFLKFWTVSLTSVHRPAGTQACNVTVALTGLFCKFSLLGCVYLGFTKRFFSFTHTLFCLWCFTFWKLQCLFLWWWQIQLLSLCIPSEGPSKDASQFDTLLFPLYIPLLAPVSLKHQISTAWSSCLIAIIASPRPATLPLSFLGFEMIHICRSPLEMGAVSSKGLIVPCTGEAWGPYSPLNSKNTPFKHWVISSPSTPQWTHL